MTLFQKLRDKPDIILVGLRSKTCGGPVAGGYRERMLAVWWTLRDAATSEGDSGSFFSKFTSSIDLMTLSAIKEKLHAYIDQSDARRAGFLLSFIEEDLSAANFEFDDATMEMLEERWSNYLSGKSSVCSVEQSMKNIQNHRLNRGV